MLESLMLVASLLESASYWKQFKAIQSTKSVFGLSYDFFLLSLVDYLTGVLCGICYLLDSIGQLYGARFPVYSTISVSKSLLLVDCLKSVFCLLIVIQLGKYESTKRKDQEFSPLCKSFLLTSGLVFLWFQILVFQGKHSLNQLDIVDFIWCYNLILKSGKYLPQVFMNWTTQSCYQNGRSIDYQLASMVLLILSKPFVIRHVEWYAIPVNYYNSVVYLTISLPLIMLLKHHKRIYVYNKKVYS